jgi:L-threonylcarbamoyladenylate synthase
MRITIKEAMHLLEKGHVVALPTETVYGLGALLNSPEAIDKIYTLKGRPSNNPLIIHVSDCAMISKYTQEAPQDLPLLAKAFWPGPLTIVMKINQMAIPEQARAGLPTAAFRIPNHPLTLQLLKTCGPLVMPSANLSGRPSSTCPEHVEEDFGSDFPVVDGGSCQNGMESTILMEDKETWKIIRLGTIPPEAFVPVLGYKPQIHHAQKGEGPLCPGQLFRHYSPRAKLILLEYFPEDLKGIVLGFNNVHYPKNCVVKVMGSLNQPETAAESIYALLRQLDDEDITQAYVDMRFPKEGLWLTIAERLYKASR